MFSKSGSDAGIGGGEKYRTIRPECSGLQLRHPQLDPATFRSLVECFNANGSIPEISRLVADASDKTIQQTVDLLNSTFLTDGKVRADSRGIVRELKQSGRWESALMGLSPTLGDPARIRALFHLISLGKRDPLIIQTVGKFNPTETMAGFELISRLVKSRPFGELLRKIQASPLTIEERDRLVSLLTDFLQRSTRYHSARLLLDDMVVGKSAPLWNFAFGEDGDVQNSTSRFTLLLRDFSVHDGLRQLSLFQRGFHRSISCWNGGVVFPEPWQNLSRELTVHSNSESDLLKFITRFGTLTALGVSDICEVPDPILDHFSTLMRLTAGRTGGEFLGLLDRFSKGDLILSGGYFVGEWGDSLADVLTILQAKPWFGDLVLLFAELDSSDRDRIATWTQSLLQNRSSWTALTSSWKKEDLDPVFADLGRFLGADPAELTQMLDSIQELFESTGTHPWFEGWKRVASESDANGIESLADLKSFPEAALAVGRMAEDGRLAVILADILELLAGAGAKDGDVIYSAHPAILRKLPRHVLSGSDLRELETPLAMDESLRACTRLDLRLRPNEQRENYEFCLGGSSSPFLDSFITSWLELPLTPEEKHEVIAMLTGKLEGLPPFSVDSLDKVLNSYRKYLGAGEVFKILNRFQRGLRIDLETWQVFFSKVERTIEDVRFVPLMKALQNVLNSVERTSSSDRKIGPAALPPSVLTGAWVHDLECESDGRLVSNRVSEIGIEFSEGVLGWERPGGALPVRWETETLKARLHNFAASLESPNLRRNLYAWFANLDPKTTTKWLSDRATDARLVAVMDPETKRLKVRWMTSLDRLESILVNSNFNYILDRNYGLKFIARFAEAWGDEPRERWPLEIQERYSRGKTPPTLADVYGEVVEFLRRFEKFGGIPSVPDCVAKNGVIARSAIDDPWASAPDLLIPFSIKAKAFNLRQTLSVIEENLPGSHAPNAGGMRFLRDLFWIVYSSAPAGDRDPGKPERNPIRFFQRFGELGGLRSMSRGIQSLSTSSELAAIEDAFGGLRLAVTEPALDRIVRRVLDHPSSMDIWIDAAMKAPAFRWGNLVSFVLNGFAADRTLHLAPALLRFVDTVLPDRSPGLLPDDLIADLIANLGMSNGSEPRKLIPLRVGDVNVRSRLAGLSRFFENRVLDAFSAFPIRDAIFLLDHDPVLRTQLFTELSRQSSGETPNSIGFPRLDYLLSETHPGFRRLVGLWCGKSAARYAYELSSHPDDSRLTIDSLLQSGQSATFSDFLDSLLRELPD